MEIDLQAVLQNVEGKHLLIALSGGADSVALASLLSQYRQSRSLKLTAAHMDHGIRPESGQDAAFCRELCRKLKIPLMEIRVDIPNASKQTGEGLESVARRVRHDWLEKMRRHVGADYIALAHHRDDQAETVLMHLFRGTGPEGIVGMRPLSGKLFRPLLDISKAQLTQYLIDRNMIWREDATNYVADNPRNCLRLNVIPEIEQSYPQARAAIVRFAQSTAIESDYLARMTDDFLQKNRMQGPYGQCLRLPENWEAAIVRRAIRQMLGSALESEKLMALMGLCQKDRGRMDVFGGILAERGRLGLYFLPKTPVSIPEVPLHLNGNTQIDGFCRIQVQSAPPVPIRDDPHRQVLLKSALQGAVVRTRQPGDRIRPLGCGEKLLSDYFTDKKIDRPLRDFVPLVAVGQNILWAVGIGISADAAIQGNRDECVLLECRLLLQ